MGHILPTVLFIGLLFSYKVFGRTLEEEPVVSSEDDEKISDATANNTGKDLKCNERSETIQHIASGCTYLANIDYVQRHCQVCSILHQNIANKCWLLNTYVIRKVVYEIGILTDADNSTEYDNRTHEQIDVSFFDPIDNGTFIDLSHIPIPVETNVSGVAVTGILSSNLGNLVFPENGSVASLNESHFPLFPDKQVKVTRNVSIVDKEKSADILSGITDVLGLSNLVKSKEGS